MTTKPYTQELEQFRQQLYQNFYNRAGMLIRQSHIKDLSRFSNEICQNESDYQDA
jgi:hypothetical protein